MNYLVVMQDVMLSVGGFPTRWDHCIQPRHPRIHWDMLLLGKIDWGNRNKDLQRYLYPDLLLMRDSLLSNIVSDGPLAEIL